MADEKSDEQVSASVLATPEVVEDKRAYARYFLVTKARDAEHAKEAVSQFLLKGDVHAILGTGMHACSPMLTTLNGPGSYTVVVEYKTF